MATRRIPITELKEGDLVAVSGTPHREYAVVVTVDNRNNGQFYVQLAGVGNFLYNEDEFIELFIMPSASAAEFHSPQNLGKIHIRGNGGSAEVDNQVNKKLKALAIIMQQMPDTIALLDAVKEGRWVDVDMELASELHFVFTETTAALEE